jgi:hypothetical protein
MFPRASHLLAGGRLRFTLWLLVAQAHTFFAMIIAKCRTAKNKRVFDEREM